MLHCETWSGGAGGEIPLVLLHGFGGCSALWCPLAATLATERPVLALDLPGHGGSIPAGTGGAGFMAKAIASVLKERGIDRFHLAGHSMGGAMAALLALRQPERLASLTLLAPGGFGPHINGAALRRYAFAEDVAQMAKALGSMCGPDHGLDNRQVQAVLDARRLPGAREALAKILKVILADPEGRTQGVLPTEDLARLPMPVQVLWGTADPILPAGQADDLPPTVAVRRLAGAGHMLVEERPEEVMQALRGIIAAADQISPAAFAAISSREAVEEGPTTT
ncbi:alpha/beta hydrolase [Pseudorhizobium endolithicum]|uniref:Alpha/beta hydrolase n=1 Tax=Pseudorhizobium endolithicum TaxID=1191678 RepID=A0ABN7JEC4_9HYPH|nr:alpha/beta fold hydrolase [Pseudorhizobium endolithicum]CAD7024375.1 alpha/beta hydrolase [Pseudorhizobium endolithicum]